MMEGANAIPICHVVYNRFPADPRVRKVARALSDRGYDVHVLCTQGMGERLTEVWNGIRVTRVPLQVVRGGRMRYAYQYGLFSLLTASMLIRNSLRFRYRVVHVHSLPDFLILAALPLRLAGSRLFLDLHESSPELFRARFGGRPQRPLVKLIEFAQMLSCRLAERVFTVNDEIRSLLEQRGNPASKITVVENAPDWAPVAFMEPESEGGQAQPTIFILGSMNRERDLETVITAASYARNEVMFRVRIIGPGDSEYRAELRRLVSAVGVADRVSFEDEVSSDAVPALLAKSVIGLVSYQRNPLTEIATPNKAYEYAACGKAIIAADLPGLRKLLGGSALFYEPGNPTDLAAKITLLLKDSRRRQELQDETSAVMELHGWHIMRQRLLAAYHSAVASKVPT